MVGRLYPVGFLIDAISLRENSQVAYSPVRGTIRQVTVSWPDGCYFLVEVLVRKGKIQIYPAQVLGTGLPEGIALNNYTLTTALNHPVGEDDILEVVAINHDSTFDHKISAVLLIEEEAEATQEQVIPAS